MGFLILFRFSALSVDVGLFVEGADGAWPAALGVREEFLDEGLHGRGEKVSLDGGYALRWESGDYVDA